MTDLSDLPEIPPMAPLTARCVRPTHEDVVQWDACQNCGIEFAQEDLTTINGRLYGPCCLPEAREREAQARDEYRAQERWARWANRV